MKPSPELVEGLLETGFSGDIPQNSGKKNWQAIKKMIKGQPFYTFGIKRVEQAAKVREITATSVRHTMIKATGISDERFRSSGPGHFDSQTVADRLIEAMNQIYERASQGQTLVFATGHPGSMLGFLDVLANWAEDSGAKIATIDGPAVVGAEFKLDMIGKVLVASDGCSVQHTHDAIYMDAYLSTAQADFVVADHGFTGAALNHGLAAIGFYDTDDPAIPVAEALGLPVLAAPFNDNNYNANGRTLALYLIERFTAHVATRPRGSRNRTR